MATIQRLSKTSGGGDPLFYARRGNITAASRGVSSNLPNIVHLPLCRPQFTVLSALAAMDVRVLDPLAHIPGGSRIARLLASVGLRHHRNDSTGTSHSRDARVWRSPDFDRRLANVFSSRSAEGKSTSVDRRRLARVTLDLAVR